MKFSCELPYFCLYIISLWLSGTLFDELLHCRLVGELLVGLLFGNLSVGTLLPADKTLFILAGEVGVLGLVFEAGLGTDIRRVLKAGPRAALVAFLGIVVPLATGFGFMYGVSQQSHIQEMESDASTGTRGSSDIVIEALASGASLASTSIAIAVTLMKQQAILDTAVGTLITTAAMLDDVVSLILLGIVSSIGGGSGPEGSDSGIRPMIVLQPILASLGIILVGVIGCAIVAKIKARRGASTVKLSRFKNKETSVETGVSVHNEDVYINQSDSFAVDLETEDDVQHGDEGMDDDNRNRTDGSAFEEESRAKKRVSSSHRQRIRNRVLIFYSMFGPTIKLAGMVIIGFGYSILAEYLGSSRLLGAFVTGVFFSAFEDLCHQYEKQIAHKIQPVMSAVFFSTIGFAIPLTKILEPVLFGWGLVYAVIATLSKLTTMFAVPAKISPSEENLKDGVSVSRYNARWVVGAAMIARGELGLLMAQQAQMQGVMGQTAMVITIWSIVLATLFGVGAFSVVMRRKL
ncbi:hypothetical protein BGZ59_002249 [Podila verticillata]|nr:hypothetical protein BGZ59_002249 [Podila verticillata]